MAVGQVNKALENGYKVHVFFGLRGVLIAARTLMIDIGTAAALSLRQQLQAAGEGRLGRRRSDVPVVRTIAMTADDMVLISSSARI